MICKGVRSAFLRLGPARVGLGSVACLVVARVCSDRPSPARLSSAHPSLARHGRNRLHPTRFGSQLGPSAWLRLGWPGSIWLARLSPSPRTTNCIIGVNIIIIGPSPRTKSCICGVKSVNNFSKMHICKFRLSAWFGLSRLPSAWLGSVQSSSAPPSSAPARVSPTRLGFGSAWLSLAWPGSARLAILNFLH